MGGCCGINIGLGFVGMGGFRIGGGVAGCMFGCTGYWISYAFSLSGVVTVVFLGRWGVGLNALVVLLLLNWF